MKQDCGEQKSGYYGTATLNAQENLVEDLSARELPRTPDSRKCSLVKLKCFTALFY